MAKVVMYIMFLFSIILILQDTVSSLNIIRIVTAQIKSADMIGQKRITTCATKSTLQQTMPTQATVKNVNTATADQADRNLSLVVFVAALKTTIFLNKIQRAMYY